MREAEKMRNELFQFVKQDLIGPADGPQEILRDGDSPQIRYGAGVLFPQGTSRDESAAVAGVEEPEDTEEVPEDTEGDPEDTEGDPEDTEGGRLKERGGSESADEPRQPRNDRRAQHDDVVTLANSYRPSAMGLSFISKPLPHGLTVSVNAAVYDPQIERSADGKHELRTWVRRELKLEPVPIHPGADPSGKPLPLKEGLNRVEGLMLQAVHREEDSGRFLTTLSLYNTTRKDSSPSRMFFQVGFVVESAGSDSPFFEYRSLARASQDDEELALEMLYRNRKAFAVGHGCAASWDDPGGDQTASVFTETLPSVMVPPIMPREEHRNYLNMEFLSGGCEAPAIDIPNALREFCIEYEDWIDKEIKEKIISLPGRFAAPAQRHLSLCNTSLERMRRGVELLASDDGVLECFMLANQVMLRQLHHSRLERKYKGAWHPFPSEYKSDWEPRTGYWRSFQLAFVLLTLTSLIDDTGTIEIDGHEVVERDLVDLIWFPTGGGKTEAYLAAAAFVIFMSRLNKTQESGCVVLMRYTLRLLTTQQFERASSLICACELVRRSNPGKFGETPISIGVWVGNTLTDGKEADALGSIHKLETKLKKREEEEARNPFILVKCPWCGTQLNSREKIGYEEYESKMVFSCPSNTEDLEDPCPFSHTGSHLPICVVDESVYKQPPTLIIGTVDKFAQLAWVQEAGRILQLGGGPSLIIQDELHLITDALGSIVGLYEGAIDFLCGRSGLKPKIIASTATIRRAHEQCRGLYNRPMFQFPSPGLDASDSYFAFEDKSLSGRMYVGFLPTASSSPLTAQIRSVVALQQGALLKAGSPPDEDVIDPYWTLVQYFSSLKELGRAKTFITADIPDFLPTMWRRYGLASEDRRKMRRAEELTSRKNETEINVIRRDLEKCYRYGAAFEEQALDTVLATNMIAVGLDVPRLGLMMIVTQPKGTSEYIQASSRVGRVRDKPGLIFISYNPGRPRDRSHYEQFRSYHESFYRFVEPSSVTPYSPPAMVRGLHALLVIVGRHAAGWKSPRDFDPANDRFVEFLDFLRNRVRDVDPRHLPEFEEILQDRLDHWESHQPKEWRSYSGDEDVLIREAGRPAPEGDRDTWETYTSMRSADVQCDTEIIATYPERAKL